MFALPMREAKSVQRSPEPRSLDQDVTDAPKQARLAGLGADLGNGRSLPLLDISNRIFPILREKKRKKN